MDYFHGVKLPDAEDGPFDVELKTGSNWNPVVTDTDRDTAKEWIEELRIQREMPNGRIRVTKTNPTTSTPNPPNQDLFGDE